MGQVVQDTQQLIERKHMYARFLYLYLQQQCVVWHVSVETDTTYRKHNVLHGLSKGGTVHLW